MRSPLCFTCSRARRLKGSIFCPACQLARYEVDEEPRRTSFVAVLSPSTDRRRVISSAEEHEVVFHGERREDA
jgi:hypothetical protein